MSSPSVAVTLLDGPELPPQWEGRLVRGLGWESWTLTGRTTDGALVCVRGLGDQTSAARAAWRAWDNHE
jgi:hypothetical protein